MVTEPGSRARGADWKRRERALRLLFSASRKLATQLTDTRYFFRKYEPSARLSRLPSGRRHVFSRDHLVNALANRCLTQAEAILVLCERRLFDDAYVLCRALVEAVMHLEFLTRSDWPVRLDTYAHFHDAHDLKLQDVFFPQGILPNKTAEEWRDVETAVEQIYGQRFPRSWRVFPTSWQQKVPGRQVKRRSDLKALGLEDEYAISRPDEPPEKPFLLQWVYRDGSSYVHTDVASLRTALADLQGNRTYVVRAAYGGHNERFCTLIAVSMFMAALTALMEFVGHPKSRMEQLANRLRRIAELT